MKRRGFLLASAGVLAGCGGGAPNIPRSAPGLKLDIVWPARTRGIDAPGGALSAAVTLESVAGGGTGFPAIDREFTTPGYTQSWVSASAVPTGIVRLVVKFFSERGGRGTLLGTAAKTVVLQKGKRHRRASTPQAKPTHTAIRSECDAPRWPHASAYRMPSLKPMTSASGNIESAEKASIARSVSAPALALA